MSLEEKVNDKQSGGLIKKTLKLGWKLGMAAATTALSLYTVGANGPIIAGAVGIGKAIGGFIKKKSLYDIIDGSLTSYSVINTVLHPMILLGDYTFPVAGNIARSVVDSNLAEMIGRGLYSTTAYAGAFVGAAGAAHHLIDNYMNPIGLGKSVSDNFYNKTARIGTSYAPGLIAVANSIPEVFGMPSFALNALFAEPYNEIKPVALPKPKSQNNYSPQLAPAANRA